MRLTFVAVAWIALSAAGYFLYSSQLTSSTQAAAARAVDLYAHEASAAITDLRVGQQAYVATGQGVAFWMPKVAATIETTRTAIAGLRQAATNGEARAAADQAAAAVNEFAEVDKRARDYVHAGQMLMAGDVVFTEGGQLAAVAAQQVELARQAERQSFDAVEAGLRKQQAIAIGGAAGVVALVTLLLAFTGTSSVKVEEATGRDVRLNRLTLGDGEDGIVSHASAAGPAQPARPALSGAAGPALPAHAVRSSVVMKTAADLATDFGRVRDSEELSRLLGRTADIVDANGLIVWVGSPDGSELRPVLTHGYGPQMLARMPVMPKSADNAAAAAYRTGKLQIVLSKPGDAVNAPGAIVAPILGPEGCIGALSAEIKAGSEGSEAVQAVAAIVASHLAGVLAAASSEAAASGEQPKAAQA